RRAARSWAGAWLVMGDGLEMGSGGQNVVQRAGGAADELAQLALVETERRHEQERVAERAQQQAVRAGTQANLETGARGDGEVFERDGGGERVAGERVAVKKRALALVGAEKRGENLLARERRGQRQVAAGQPLGEAEKIGRHALVGADEHRAEPAERDEHLVE